MIITTLEYIMVKSFKILIEQFNLIILLVTFCSPLCLFNNFY